jgi:hypothetical protein
MERVPANTIDLIAPLWNALLADTFDSDHLTQCIMLGLGHDGNGLSSKVIMEALYSNETCPWRDIGWACRESFSAFYRTRPEETERFFMYVALSCLWADAIAYKQLEWDGSFDEILRFACVNISTGNYSFRVRWFGYLLRAL